MKNKVIDLSYLKTISTGNRTFELKILETFAEQATAETALMSDSLLKKNWNALYFSSHKIKPSFHFVGGLEAEILLNRIEGITRDKNGLEDLPGLVNTFLLLCKEILAEVRKAIEKYKE